MHAKHVSFLMPNAPITREGDRYSLAIPIQDAVAFAMGWSDLDYAEPQDALRQIIGTLAVDALQYNEEWRMAAMLRACLAEKWTDLDF